MAHPLDQSVAISTLMWLQPRNQAAEEVVEANRKRPNRVVKLARGPVEVNMLHISLAESCAGPRGIIGFGRHSESGIHFSDMRISSHHCYIDINGSSGELILHHTGRQFNTTWLDNEPVASPPQRALVPHHANFLRIGPTEFQIHWPPVDAVHQTLYRQSKIEAAARLQNEQKLNLTVVDLALSSHPATRPPTRPGTPARMPKSTGRDPIECAELGRGAFGRAMLAVDRITADFLVVKHIKKEQGAHREIDILYQLQHDNIVRLLGWRETLTSIRIELEYCDLGNMDSLLHVLRKDHKQINSFWKQCGAGIQYLHSMNFVHRDLKPANILALRRSDSTYHWKLADFGLANSFAGVTACGTPDYAAPEVWTGKYLSSIDIFSFGLVLLAAFGVFKPARAAWPARGKEIWQMLRELEPITLHVNFIRRMVSTKPGQRPTIDACLEYVRMQEDGALEANILSRTTNRKPVQSLETKHLREKDAPRRLHCPQQQTMPEHFRSKDNIERHNRLRLTFKRDTTLFKTKGKRKSQRGKAAARSTAPQVEKTTHWQDKRKTSTLRQIPGGWISESDFAIS